MIQCEKWQEPQNARYLFGEDDIKIIKSSISQMRSIMNRLEKDYTKHDSFINGLTFGEIVKLHNYLGMFFSVSCSLLERVSDAETEVAQFLSKFV